MKLEPEKQQSIKEIVGAKAAEYVQSGMLVGLGTGTTAVCFIERLIERCKEGLKIHAVSSSERSLEMAKKGGIPIADIDHISSIDLTIDGADEIDPQNRMIKGGGGAHVREKILASSSREMIVIVDESKVVSELGRFGLPVEIIPFGYTATITKLKKQGYSGELRTQSNGTYYITDNGNYIFDIHTPKRFPYPESDHETIVNIPGIVDTGFFFNLATKVLIGYSDGRIEIREG